MTNWTREELHAYILIWCANADFIEDKNERDLIIAKVGQDTHDRMLSEFEADNDQGCIDKITASMKRLNYSDSDKAQLFEEMKIIFAADGDTDILEQNLRRGLKHIL